MRHLLDLADVMAVLRRLVEVSCQQGEPVGGPVVLVGGSALAAHGLRALSVDVDAYLPSVSDEAVHQVEQELKGLYGEAFRLDVTSTENLWGTIMVRDILDSPVVATIQVEGCTVPVKPVFYSGVWNWGRNPA